MRTVSINVLNFNHARYLERCLQSIAAQTYQQIELLVMDNGSSDDSLTLLKRNYKHVRLTINAGNLGYAGGHNTGVRLSQGAYFMPLNPDVFMTPTFIEETVRAIETAQDIGMVQGKLLRAEGGSEKIIDAVGVDVTKNRKNYEIGSGEIDHAQYDEGRYVFGAFGAAPLYRREMLEDVQVEGEYFDEDFFAYREEVDLAWRAQLRGWKCLYTPAAVAYHVHRYRSETRQAQPAFNRRLQFRNRYLLIAKNDSLENFLRHAPHIFWFEICALGYACLCEPTLLQGYIEALRLLPKILRKRAQIMQRRKIDHAELCGWFH